MLSRLLCALLLIAFVSGELPFRNTSLSWRQRTDDLVHRLSLTEVIEQLARGGAGSMGGPAPAIPRLGIAAYQWNTECLRGDVEAGPATSFPQAIGLAASFDLLLIWRVANATGAEVRAKHNAAPMQTDHTGLSCFSPVINIMRHPLWGRAQETYGECPFLTGHLASAFVSGLAGTASRRFLQASAVCKHFAAHSGPEDIPSSRLSFDAEVPRRDLELTYLPAFEACTGAGARGVMCSYNRLNGVPACANGWLLTEVLRTRWRFPGYVVSDEGALEFAISFHHYFKDPTKAAATSAQAGVDLELGPNITANVFSHLPEALQRGWISEYRLRQMLMPLMETRMMLGEFDPPQNNPYTRFRPEGLVQSQQHRALSLEAAMRSFVLLKNDGRLLPWAGAPAVSLIGPFAHNMSYFYGDYAPTRMPAFEVSLARALGSIGSLTDVVEGCIDGPKCTAYNGAAVQRAAGRAKVLVLALGVSADVETENFDRRSLKLPGQQDRLLKDALSAAQSSARILLLLFSGTPVAIGPAVTSAKVSAILWCGYPAQTAGEAIAATLKDSRHLLAGRLPFTWYANDSQLPSRTQYRMSNQTYRYLSIAPQFPFGFGLSLSKFQYSELKLPKRLQRDAALVVQARVCNVGTRAAEEVSQVYVRWPSGSEMPKVQLVGFRRTNVLQSQECELLSFRVFPSQRRVWKAERFVDFVGLLLVSVGGQQPNAHVKVPSNVLHGQCVFY